MLVHHRLTPPPPAIKFAGIQLYTWAEKGTVRVKSQDYNIMFPARARARTAQSGNERPYHEATSHVKNARNYELLLQS